jgi:hypothetical protein
LHGPNTGVLQVSSRVPFFGASFVCLQLPSLDQATNWPQRPLTDLHHLSHLHSQQTITASAAYKLSSISHGRINSFLSHTTTPSFSSKFVLSPPHPQHPSCVRLAKGILDTSNLGSHRSCGSSSSTYIYLSPPQLTHSSYQ